MTETRSFGSSSRENHDASAFYERDLLDLQPLRGPEEVNEAPDVNAVFTRDAREMRELPDNCVALMVTSPPYNVGKDYDENLSLSDYLCLLHDVFRETYRVLVPGGRAAVNIANLGRKPYLPLNGYVAQMMTDLGFNMRAEIIWQKAEGANGSVAWGSWMSASNPVLRDIHEYIQVFSKGPMGRPRDGRVNTVGKEEFMRDTLSIWKFPPESASRVGHPAPFPVELPSRLIHLYTYEGDLVLDPFLGSGTTAVAAVQAGRCYVGYEIDEEYVALTQKRLHDVEAVV